MAPSKLRMLLSAAIVVAAVAAPVVADGHGHGHDEQLQNITSNSNDGNGMHGMTPFNMTDFRLNYDPESFMSIAEDRSLLLLHITFMVLAFVFVLPVSLMFSIAGNPLQFPIHLAFLALVALGLAPGALYASRAPDLYPGNVHSKFAYILVAILILHFVASLFKTLLAWALTSSDDEIDGMDDIDHDHHADDADSAHVPLHRPSHDGGSFSGSAGSDATLNGYQDEIENTLYGSGDPKLSSSSSSSSLRHQHSPEHRIQRYIASRLQPLRLALNALPRTLLAKLHLLASVFFSIFNRPLVVIGFFQIMTGIITAGCIGRDRLVFNMLAHTIKGSVFLWFGVLTFARVLGAFANLGWAWNIRPQVPSSSLSWGARFFDCNMEMVESGLIFFYGITNVFMEHMANPGGEWSHKDLQHASIAFMFIGGGLGGLLFESNAVRGLLNAPVAGLAARSSANKHNHVDQAPVQYGFSFNPFPGFTVFWTGILMSQHHQATELSTTIHMQWGYLLAIGALLRLLTYTIMYVSPPTSVLPSRPLSEVLVGFCLIAGGIVFVASEDEAVGAMLYYNIDAMFTMNLTVGFTALFMSWITILMAFKGWAFRRR
ncbi:hypothetical protein V1514DRAFT_323618 [Lipomyces japonicus]|uniref:uncharacterized protein n=1 Tax=Lipomyces japonicus TaxID=56871 RepID=UPI0034CD1190